MACPEPFDPDVIVLPEMETWTKTAMKRVEDGYIGSFHRLP
jgi:hypothetical protein